MIRRQPRSTLSPYTTLFRSYHTHLSDLRLHRGVVCVCVLGIKRSEEHTSELQSHLNLVCRLLLEKKTCARVPPSRGVELGGSGVTAQRHQHSADTVRDEAESVCVRVRARSRRACFCFFLKKRGPPKIYPFPPPAPFRY